MSLEKLDGQKKTKVDMINALRTKEDFLQEAQNER